MHPFAEDTSDMTVSQLYDKVAELTGKYFAKKSNPIKVKLFQLFAFRINQSKVIKPLDGRP